MPPPNLRSVLKTLQQEKQRRRRLAPSTVQMIAAAAVFVLLIIGNLLPGSDNYYIGTRSNSSPQHMKAMVRKLMCVLPQRMKIRC